MEQQTNRGPKVTLGQYKGLSITRRVRRVSEFAVQHEVEHLARTHAVYHPSTEPARRGSKVTLDFEGFMDGQPIPDSRMTKVTVCLGEGKLMPDAEKAVYGHRAGETFRFDFTYPSDFRVPELSGQTAQFEIVLHAVAEKYTPAPDEAFAKSIGFASLDALKEDVRQKKRVSHDENADRKAGMELLDMAGANLTVDIPGQVLDETAANEVERLKARLSKGPVSYEEYCKNSRTTPEQVYAGYRKDAERNVRRVLATRAIAEAEKIVVHNAEVEAEYVRLSRLHGTPEDEIRKVLAPDAIAAAITSRKVQQFLLKHAMVTTIEEQTDKE
ncbi:MAG: trigger factor [Faecalibacterium sp.]